MKRNSGLSCVWAGNRAPGSNRTSCISQPSVTAMSFTKTPDATVDGHQGRSSTFTDWKAPRSGALTQDPLERSVAPQESETRPSGLSLARRSPGAHGSRELGEDGDCHLPAHAGVGNALAVAQRGWIGQLLAAVDEKALHHHAEDCRLAVGDLPGDVAPGDRLAAVDPAAVAAARGGQEPPWDAGRAA